MIDSQDLMQTLMALVEQCSVQSPATDKADALVVSQLAPLLDPAHDVYLVPLTQKEIGAIAGFLAPTSSEIDCGAISILNWDDLRDKFPELAFWECVEKFGEDFYSGES